MMHKLFAVFPVLILIVMPSISQKLAYDSLVIKFGTTDSQKNNIVIDTVVDLRKLNANCIGINEISKYYYIPVDYHILIELSIADAINKMFLQKNDTAKIPVYSLEIKEFTVKPGKIFFRNFFNCNAAISVYTMNNKMISNYYGTLVYETNTWKTKDKSAQENYEKAIDDWKVQFSSDMDKLNLCNINQTNCSLAYFRKERFVYKKNLISGLETSIGLDSWLVDGEIIFSKPEAQKKFFRNAYSLRYRKEKKLESFETSMINKQINYRLSNAFLFILKTKMFLGLNHWNENEFRKHGLEDMFLLDYSLSQHIVFNKFYKKGLILGIGIMENINYIYSRNIVPDVYAIIQTGIKL